MNGQVYIDPEIRQAMQGLNFDDCSDTVALMHFLHWRRTGYIAHPYDIFRGAMIHIWICFLQLIGKA